MAFYFPPAKARSGWCRNWKRLVPADVEVYISEVVLLHLLDCEGSSDAGLDAAAASGQ